MIKIHWLEPTKPLIKNQDEYVHCQKQSHQNGNRNPNNGCTDFHFSHFQKCGYLFLWIKPTSEITVREKGHLPCQHIDLDESAIVRLLWGSGLHKECLVIEPACRGDLRPFSKLGKGIF